MDRNGTAMEGNQTSDPDFVEEEYVTSGGGGRSLTEGNDDIDVEEVLQALGPRGRYQILQMTMQLISSFVAVVPTMAIVFIGE